MWRWASRTGMPRSRRRGRFRMVSRGIRSTARTVRIWLPLTLPGEIDKYLVRACMRLVTIGHTAWVNTRVREFVATIDPVVLGERMRLARIRAGLTQSQVAGEDVSTAYISRIEAGQRRPGA